MTSPKFWLLAGTVALGLSACTNADRFGGGEDPNKNTKSGALLGGLVGAVAGIAMGDDEESRRRGAVIGAAVGAGAGGLIGQRLDQQEAALRQSLNNDQVRITNTGSELIVTMPQDILFAVDSTSLRGDLQSDLRTLAQNLNDYPDTTVDIIGHTDNTGDAGYNQGLSKRRADAVAAVLVNSGVSSNRLRAYGRGEDAPVSTNLTPEGRAQNRRVEIIIRPIA